MTATLGLKACDRSRQPGIPESWNNPGWKGPVEVSGLFQADPEGLQGFPVSCSPSPVQELLAVLGEPQTGHIPRRKSKKCSGFGIRVRNSCKVQLPVRFPPKMENDGIIMEGRCGSSAGNGFSQFLVKFPSKTETCGIIMD